MSLENSLNTSNRLDSLIKVNNLLLEQIYKYCYICGLDPDTFFCQEYIDQNKFSDPITINSHQASLMKYSENYLIVQEKMKLYDNN
jgi:hypothetical protein